MFISGINFTLLLFFVNRKFKKVIHDAELKWYFWSVVLFTGLIAVILYYSNPIGMEDAFRKSLFQVISLHTSTGFATDDYMLWPAVTWGLLTIVMLMGACAGSTTGGLKCIRMVILGKVARNEFKHILHPNAILPVRINKQVISPLHTIYSTGFLLYICSNHYHQRIDYDGNGYWFCRIRGVCRIQYRQHGSRARRNRSRLLMECTTRCGEVVNGFPYVAGTPGIIYRIITFHSGILEKKLI